MVLSDDEVNGVVMGIRTEGGLAAAVVIDLNMTQNSRERLGIRILRFEWWRSTVRARAVRSTERTSRRQTRERSSTATLQRPAAHVELSHLHLSSSRLERGDSIVLLLAAASSTRGHYFRPIVHLSDIFISLWLSLQTDTPYQSV